MPKIKSIENYHKKIYPHDEELLFAALQEKLRKEAESGKTDITDRWEKFSKYYWPRTKDGSFHLHYDRIGDFLEVSGISYAELLDICASDEPGSSRAAWPKKIEKSMASLADGMPEELVRFVRELTESMLPDSILEQLKTADKSINRVFAIAEIQATDTSYMWPRLDDGKRYLRQSYLRWKDEDKAVPDMLPFCFVKRVSEAFDLSPHFLLGLSEKETCLCRKGRTEILMDAFCVLPDLWKSRVYAGAKAMSDAYKQERKEAKS